MRSKYEEKDDKNNRDNTLINSNINNYNDKSLHNVQKLSEEWRFVEFHLKSAVPFETDIKNIAPIHNQHMLINFEKHARGKLHTYAWFDVNNVDDKNKLPKLRSRGFEIGNNGMDFIVGTIFDENSDENGFSELESNYILCKIIIGRSYCKIVKDKIELDKYAMENAFKNMRPSGYDSIVFCPTGSSYNKISKGGFGMTKSFRYRIFEATNVLPMYSVVFGPVDQNLVSYVSKRYCAECSEKDAEWYCINCEEYMCKECYNIIHGEKSADKNYKLIMDHKKEEVSKIKTGRCVFDPDKEVEYYCNNCNLAICSYCRVIGSHSRGDALTHDLVDIGIALENGNPEKLDIIKSCEDKKKKGIEALSKVKIQIEKLRNQMQYDTDKRVQAEFSKESEHVQSKSLELLNSYLTTINELYVIKDSMNYLDKYFTDREAYLKENNNKAEFIWVWNHHNKILQEIMNNKLFITTDFKNPDMRDIQTEKTSEIRVNHYRFEDTHLKEQNKDEVQKSSKDQRKLY